MPLNDGAYLVALKAKWIIHRFHKNVRVLESENNVTWWTLKNDKGFRNKILKTFSDGVVIQVGYDVDRDFPVETYKIPKLIWDMSNVNSLYRTFDAHYQLIFSKYFPKYLGSNLIADEHHFLFFMELTRGHTMEYLIHKLFKPIDLQSHWF